MKGGSVLFLTDVTVFVVTVLRIGTNHVFVIYVEKPLNECEDTFSVMQLWVLLTFQVANALRISVLYRFELDIYKEFELIVV